MAVGVARVTADSGAAVDGRGEELRAAGAPVAVNGGDVGDADVEEGADPVRVGGRLEGDGGFVGWVVRAGVDDAVSCGQCDDQLRA